jgi:anti-sigma factor RsiW
MSDRNEGQSHGAPTDLELMLYADGELEGEEAAAVEAYLARDANARAKLAAMGIVGGVVRAGALASTAKADGIADAVMAQIAKESAEKPASAPVVPLRPARPANQNALWAVAVVAVAAAAGLLVWARGTTSPVGPVASGPTAPLSAQSDGRPMGRDAAVRLDSGGVVHGVEVAAVDFGAHSGAVFYVPTGSADSATTTVVWLSDDSSGGNE